MGDVETIPLFPESEVPRILAALVEACTGIHKRSETEKEDAISDRVRRRLKRNTYIRQAPFCLLRETQVFDDDNSFDEWDGQSGRIDICFMLPPGDETYFAVEAKRLHVTMLSGWKSLVSEYVSGDQGMMCFITGKYSSAQNCGAMLGYVFDGNTVKATAGIKKSINTNAGLLKLDTNGELSNSGILDGNLIKETKHCLQNDRLFTIYHLLVSV